MCELVGLIEKTLTEEFLSCTYVIDKIAEILRQIDELDLKKLVELGKHLDVDYFYILDLGNLAVIRQAYDGENWETNFPYVLDFIHEYLEMVVGLKSITEWDSKNKIISIFRRKL